MKIVYCITNLSLMRGIERGTIVRANAISQIAGNQVWICVSDDDGPPCIPLVAGVKLVDLDINYNDYGYGLRVLRKKRKLHRERLQSFLNEVCPDIVVSVGHHERNFLPFLKLDCHPVLVKELRMEKHFRQKLAKNWKGRQIAKLIDLYEYNIVAPRYDAFVVLTEEEKERNWKNNPKVVVMHNCLIQQIEKKSDCTQKLAIALGTFTVQKNFLGLVRIWQEVNRRHPDWRLEIWGDGEERAAVERDIKALGLEEKVSLMGYTKEPLQQMSRASIYLLTSIYEGMPNVLMEAMSEGLASVSYTCPTGPRDLIDDGRTGFLVEMGDEKTFAERVCQLIEQPELRCAMGQAALKASEDYQPAPIIERWMQLFQRLVAEKGKKK